MTTFGLHRPRRFFLGCRYLGLPDNIRAPQPSKMIARNERMLGMETCFESGVGFVHVYTGDGKGKTTAALGLALARSERVGMCSSPSLSRA